MQVPTAPQHVVDLHHTKQTPIMTPTQAGGKKKLIVCFLGIFVSYFIYGLLQEKITKGHYGEDGNERFTFTLALVFVQCVINAIFAQLAISMSATAERDTSPQKLYGLMAFSYIAAMVASNHSLLYVSYPTQVLGKSVKPIPVMILGVLLAQKRYPLAKYLFVLMITLGVALFLYKDKKAGVDTDHSIGFGEMLLVFSLLMDGVTGGVQDKLRAEHHTHTHRMMLYMNLWSILYLALGLVVTGEGIHFVRFATNNPIVLAHLLSFSLCSAIGQNFIFMTVTNFGPLTCSIITTTRKFFTILSSVLIFGHPMTMRQWSGTGLVFVGLGLDSAFGKERKATTK